MFTFLFRAELELERIEKLVIFVALCALIVTLFLQVLFRFVLSSPLAFTEELARICMIWLVFIGSARALQKCEHFLVDALLNLMPTVPARLIGYLVDAVTIVFIVIMAKVGLDLVLRGSGQVMPSLGVSVAVQTVAMPLGCAFMLVHAICAVARRQHINVEPANHDATIEREV